jgi:hypothetical protein
VQTFVGGVEDPPRGRRVIVASMQQDRLTELLGCLRDLRSGLPSGSVSQHDPIGVVRAKCAPELPSTNR